MNRISIPKHEWDEKLVQLLSSFEVYAPVENDFSCDYEKLVPESVPEVVYNKPKPVTPLKKFFLPVKENVTSESSPQRAVIVLGVPNCDVMAQSFLDLIYLDKEYPDPAYQERRDNTLIISSDCYSIQEHCHCTSYDIQPTGGDHADLSIALIEDQILLDPFMGSGTTALAALACKRHYVGFETEPEYVELAEQRIGGS